MRSILIVNGQRTELDVDPEMPLLWVLRDLLGLIGATYGCAIGACGACMVLIDGRAERSCVTAAREAAGKKITTIEGLGVDRLHPLQRAWIGHQVPQCGYCQSGMLMAAAALLERNPQPSDADIDAAMAGNICRCGTYPKIKSAIRLASAGGKK